MKKMKWKTGNLKTILIAVLCAIVIWFVIAVNVYRSTTVRFSNIPVEVDLTGTAAEFAGLSAVSCDVEKVNLKLTGNRDQIGRLSAEDLTAYVEFGNINASGEYMLNLNVRTNNGITFGVDTISPSVATVKLDKIETRSYDVSASYPNIVVTAGHALDTDEVVCEPATIDITGPAAQLDQIDKVVVYSDSNVELDSSYQLYASTVNLYTESGAKLDTESLELPSIDFRITIPVLTTKDLALTYNLNAPNGFDTDWLRERIHLSEDTISLAALTSTALPEDGTWPLGSIRLSSIDLEYSNIFDIVLDEGIINRSGFQQVTAELDSEDLTSRVITIDDDNIFLTNKPSSYDLKIVTKALDVTVIGLPEDLAELSAEDIMATVDATNYDAEQSAAMTAVISFYDHPRVWAYGTYKVALDRVEEASTETGEDE